MNVLSSRSIVAALLIASALFSFADSDSKYGITWTYTVSNGKASLGDGFFNTAVPSTTRGGLTIPSNLGGYPVMSIGSSAFRNCSGHTSVTIGNSVTSIGANAFRDCSGLTSVTIPGRVPSFGDVAFYICRELMRVTYLPLAYDIKLIRFEII